MHRTKSPPRKSVLSPAQRSILHPQSVEKSFAGLEEIKQEQRDTRVAPKWDDIYDPTPPNLYQDCFGSAEERKDKAEWKARLYAHRLAQGRGGGRVDKRRHDAGRLEDRKGR